MIKSETIIITFDIGCGLPMRSLYEVRNVQSHMLLFTDFLYSVLLTTMLYISSKLSSYRKPSFSKSAN